MSESGITGKTHSLITIVYGDGSLHTTYMVIYQLGPWLPHSKESSSTISRKSVQVLEDPSDSLFEL